MLQTALDPWWASSKHEIEQSRPMQAVDLVGRINSGELNAVVHRSRSPSQVSEGQHGVPTELVRMSRTYDILTQWLGVKTHAIHTAGKTDRGVVYNAQYGNFCLRVLVSSTRRTPIRRSISSSFLLASSESLAGFQRE